MTPAPEKPRRVYAADPSTGRLRRADVLPPTAWTLRGTFALRVKPLKRKDPTTDLVAVPAAGGLLRVAGPSLSAAGLPALWHPTKRSALQALLTWHRREAARAAALLASWDAKAAEKSRPLEHEPKG